MTTLHYLGTLQQDEGERSCYELEHFDYWNLGITGNTAQVQVTSASGCFAAVATAVLPVTTSQQSR